MKGIILAGGLGTRLDPLTRVTNKHLLPVYDRPMIHYPIECLVNAGIRDILIVTGGGHAEGFSNLLGDGSELGIEHLEFACQQGEGGIADALKLGEAFAKGGKTAVILGDNIIEGTIRGAVDEFRAQPSGARLMLTQVPDPENYGVASFAGDGPSTAITQITEKPTRPDSNWVVTGIYFYDGSVFDICGSLRRSDRGELEITDVNNAYLERGDLTFGLLDGWWIDAGTIEGLHRAAQLVASGKANHLELPASPRDPLEAHRR